MLVLALLPDVTFSPMFHDAAAEAWRFGGAHH
jgi:hypothetical protein